MLIIFIFILRLRPLNLGGVRGALTRSIRLER
jgi:hypothetical protein